MKEKIKNIFEKVCRFISNNMKWIMIFACILLIVINFKTCSSLSSQKQENFRLNNNNLALNDTLKNYKDKGYNVAEMRALQLRIEELSDSLKLERGKTPVTIIQYVARVSDTFDIKPIILHDTVYIDDDMHISDMGVIKSHEYSTFGKSSRYIDIETPYMVNCDDGLMYANGESSVVLEQNIWFESVLYKDRKNYTYLKLKTDYPGVTFNSGEAIYVIDSKNERKLRKQFGLGIGIQAGYGVSTANGILWSPYIGIGIGLQWNPRFLQF